MVLLYLKIRIMKYYCEIATIQRKRVNKMKFYSERFAAIRKSKKISLKVIADVLGRSYTGVRRWEKGERIPSESDVRILVKILKVSLNEISDLKENNIGSDSINNLTSEVFSDKLARELKNFDNGNDIDNLRCLCKTNEDYRARIELLETRISNLKYIWDHAPIIIYSKDINRRFRYVNDAFAISTNIYTRNDIIGTKSSEIFGIKEISKLNEYENEVYETRERLFEKKITIPGSNGKKIGQLSVTPLISNHELQGIVCIIEDITDLELANEKNKRLIEVIHKLDECVIIQFLNSDTYEFLSKSIEKITGRNVKEFYNDPKLLEELFHQDDLKKLLNKMKTAELGNYLKDVKVRIKRITGEYIWISASFFKTNDKISGREMHFGILKDISLDIKKENL